MVLHEDVYVFFKLTDDLPHLGLGDVDSNRFLIAVCAEIKRRLLFSLTSDRRGKEIQKALAPPPVPGRLVLITSASRSRSIGASKGPVSTRVTGY